MANEKTIWDLKLHEETNIDTDEEVYIRRVPGGWIYMVVWGTTGVSGVFVPLSEDLKPTEEPAETVVDLGDVD